jgi:hypothetical protein
MNCEWHVFRDGRTGKIKKAMAERTELTEDLFHYDGDVNWGSRRARIKPDTTRRPTVPSAIGLRLSFHSECGTSPTGRSQMSNGCRLIDVLPSHAGLTIVHDMDTPEATHIRYRVRCRR